ncbi:MerR family DNA-binding protein [Chamaesiphon polymorphus]|uniref:Heavy metal-responsive transcriptional regulator n=1 Tax=Chamaesiphon polymorphus CCALA 037 TaxID=2107692 RepID=A0A2T1G732_9CYAN|nr:MerR family DNA-binding protein [Chamaesiphon polymorphus]PSB53051.1 heavy metal-responsive transcriptional regulator [Chamaesiphon polymorphus CCALA 037]
MLIGELAQKTGLSKDTIRFYAKIGLIFASDRRAGSRIYQEFSTETMERLLLITQGKSLGFTLNEMKQLVDAAIDGSLPLAEKIKVTESKLVQIKAKIEQLQAIEIQLTAKLGHLKQLDLSAAPNSEYVKPNIN